MEKIYIKIDKKLDVGTNEIEFTPQEEGEYIYSCWMNMIKNKIKGKGGLKGGVCL